MSDDLATTVLRNPFSSDRPLRIRILVLPILLIVGLLGSAAFTVVLVAQQRATGDVVDLAATRALLDGSLLTLREGGPAVANPAAGDTTDLPAADPTLHPLLDDQRTSLDALYAAVDAFTGGTGALTPVLAANAEVDTTANGAVQAFGAASRSQADTAVVRAVLLAALLAVGGGALAWFVGRSLTAAVSGRSSQLGVASDALYAVATQVGSNAEETATQADVVAATGEQVSSTRADRGDRGRGTLGDGGFDPDRREHRLGGDGRFRYLGWGSPHATLRCRPPRRRRGSTHVGRWPTDRRGGHRPPCPQHARERPDDRGHRPQDTDRRTPVLTGV